MTLLHNSMFYDILFPADEDDGSQGQLFLQKVLRFQPFPEAGLHSVVVFDFETTGLDTQRDRIIEIGAIKYQDGKRVADFATLIKPDVPISEMITNITGITPEMLENQPSIESQLPDFLQFIDKSFLVAHNAEFDMAILRAACQRMGYQIEYPCFCTLKMARQLLPDLEDKKLDTLAKHYGLTFAARHRSIGDCEVTASVLHAMVRENQVLQQWKDYALYQVVS